MREHHKTRQEKRRQAKRRDKQSQSRGNHKIRHDQTRRLSHTSLKRMAFDQISFISVANSSFDAYLFFINFFFTVFRSCWKYETQRTKSTKWAKWAWSTHHFSFVLSCLNLSYVLFWITSHCLVLFSLILNCFVLFCLVRHGGYNYHGFLDYLQIAREAKFFPIHWVPKYLWFFMLTFTTSSQEEETTQCDKNAKSKVTVTFSINSITLQKTRHNNHTTRQDHRKTRQENPSQDTTRKWQDKTKDEARQRTHENSEEKWRRGKTITKQGKTRQTQGKARQDKTRQSKTRQLKTRQDNTIQYKATQLKKKTIAKQHHHKATQDNHKARQEKTTHNHMMTRTFKKKSATAMQFFLSISGKNRLPMAGLDIASYTTRPGNREKTQEK